MKLHDYAIWNFGTTYQVELWTNKGLLIRIVNSKEQADQLIKDMK